MSLADNDVLLISLEAAVPLHIMELASVSGEERLRIGRAAVEPITNRGDALLFGGKKGAAAEVFNALARGLAALAYQPGGVTFAGRHWCTDHAACQAAERSVRGGA